MCVCLCCVFICIFSFYNSTRVKKRPAPWEHKAIEVDEDAEGGVETSAQTKNLNVTQSPSKPKAEHEEKESRRGPGKCMHVCLSCCVCRQGSIFACM